MPGKLGRQITAEEKKMMKSKALKALLTVGTAFACALSLAQSVSAQPEDRDFEARTLVGSWTVQVTQVDCQTGEALGSPFFSMLTFGPGGILLETTSNPMFFPAVRGPGHGVWSHGLDRSFKAVSVAFITLNGVLVKTQTITQTIELGEDPDTFKTTSASVTLVPAGGGSTISGCAIASGTRIK
jgi:hypothetical protein